MDKAMHRAFNWWLYVTPAPTLATAFEAGCHTPRPMPEPIVVAPDSFGQAIRMMEVCTNCLLASRVPALALHHLAAAQHYQAAAIGMASA